MPTVKRRRVPALERFFAYGLGWNVSLANVMLDVGELPEPELQPIGRYAHMIQLGEVQMKRHDSRAVDLERPCLRLDFGELGILFIDGFHRVQEAERRGRSHLPMITLTNEMERVLRLDPRNPAWKRLDEERRAAGVEPAR